MERDAIQRMYDGEPYDFNSHAHVERDLQLVQITEKLVHFNSHAHVERDMKTCQISLILAISTHTLTWSVTNVTIKRQ